MKIMKRTLLLGIALSFVIGGLRAQSIEDARKAIDAEQFAKARGILETLIKNQPKRGENYFSLGRVHIYNEHLDSARIVFEQGLAADPKNNLNHVGVGMVALYEGNQAAAEAKFAEVTGKLRRKDYVELYHIGRAYIDAPAPNYANAIKYLDQAKLKNPKDPLISLALGDAYFNSNNASLAYKNYREAVLLDNSLTRAKVQLAVISRGSHAWQEAIDDLKKVAAENPDYAPTYRELAETYNAWANRATTMDVYNQRNKEGLEYYKKYMDLTDYSVESRIRYADFLVYIKDYKELQTQAAELAKLEDINPKVLRYLGYAAYQNGEYQESKEALDRLMQRMGKERTIAQDYLHLGLADLKLASSNGVTDVALFDEGISQLQGAVEKDSTIAGDLQEFGRDFMDNKQYLSAAKVFEIAANTPSSRNYVTDNYYFGIAAYYGVNTAISEGQPKDEALLLRADKAFATVIEKAPEITEPYLYRAWIHKLLDDDEQSKGLAAPFYEKYYEIAKEKGGEEFQKAKAQLTDYYNGLAYASINNEKYEEARDYLAETLKFDPENAWAKETIELLKPQQ